MEFTENVCEEPDTEVEEVAPFADEPESDSDDVSYIPDTNEALANIPIENYSDRKELYKNCLLNDEFASHRHAVLVRLIFLDEFNNEIFKDLRKRVRNHENNCDFLFIILIRELFLDQNPKTAKHREIVGNIFSRFRFWPREGTSGPICKSIFWSENHIFMYLSTAHLFRQYSQEHGLDCTVTEREEKLLMCYLEAHRDFEGIYEVLSHTYMPYTIAALLNLIDFSSNNHIVNLATTLMQTILVDLMYATTQQGICTLTASARTFPKYRQSLHGHNINQLILLLTGRSVDPPRPCHISQFFLTSSYEPPMAELIEALNFNGYIREKRCSHRIGDIMRLYNRNEDIKKCDLTPFYWSAGLVAHPKFVELTKEYQNKFNLNKNPHLKSLMCVPRSVAQYTMKIFDSYSEGQCYTDITLHLCKSGNLMLSSFDKYNVGKCGFQQLPWMANVNGLGIWSHSGGGSIFGFEITNSRCPYVTQRKNVLICAYIRREDMLSRICDCSSYVVWPAMLFDAVSYSPLESNKSLPARQSKYPKDMWWVGQRGDCFVGLKCTRSTELEKRSGDHFRESGDAGRKIELPKIKCSKPLHSWICIVGTTSRHATLADFSTYCHSAVIADSVKTVKGKGIYTSTVEIDGKTLRLEHNL